VALCRITRRFGHLSTMKVRCALAEGRPAAPMRVWISRPSAGKQARAGTKDPMRGQQCNQYHGA
jgi:hypothetical protein